jgi:hypothetical protein
MKIPKRTPQRFVYVEGRHVAVTFTPAEEARVRGRAKRLGVSVDVLITREIDRRVRAGAKTGRPVDERIARAVELVAAPKTRKKKRSAR